MRVASRGGPERLETGSPEPTPQVGCRLVALIATLSLLALAGCARGEQASPSGGPEGGGDRVAAMFLRNRDKLQSPSEVLERTLKLDVAGFVTPLPGSGSNEVTLDLVVSNEESGPRLVVAAVVPYAVGDLERGPGARFVALENHAFELAPGEKKQVSVRALRERIPGAGSTAAPPGVLPGAPAPDVGGGTTPEPGTGEAPSAPKDIGLRPVQAVSPSPLFDPSLGLKVLVVVQEATRVDPGVLSRLREVSESEFERTYGGFAGREFAIPVPPGQII